MMLSSLPTPHPQGSEDYGDLDDSSDQTPSKASKSPQKSSSKRPKTVPVKVNLLDGSQYETGVEVRPGARLITRKTGYVYEAISLSALQYRLAFARSRTRSHTDGGVSHAGRPPAKPAGREQSG